MFGWRQWRRRRRLAPFREWKGRAVETLVMDVFETGTPFQYETAPSFLQPEAFDASDPVRVDLFFPEWPLAIDLLGPASHPSFTVAAPFSDRPGWEREQERRARKQRLFAHYNCPYLQLWDDEAVDPVSLAGRVRELTGVSPR